MAPGAFPCGPAKRLGAQPSLLPKRGPAYAPPGRSSGSEADSVARKDPAARVPSGISLYGAGMVAQSCWQFAGYHSTRLYNSKSVAYGVYPDRAPERRKTACSEPFSEVEVILVPELDKE